MLQFCLFESIKDTVPKPSSVGSFRELVGGFSPAAPFGMHYAVPFKEAAPLCAPVTFKDGARRRQKGLVLTVNAAIFDLDDVPEEAVLRVHEGLKTAGINHVLRSSYSDKGHGHERRFRAVLELDRPVPADDWGDLWDRLNQRFMEGLADGQCKDPSRIYYAPSFPGHGTVAPTSMSFLDGGAIQSGRILAEPRPAAATAPLPDHTRASAPMLQDLVKRLRRRKDPSDGYALDLVLNGHPFAEQGSRDLTLFRVCCRIAEAFPDVDPKSVAPFFRASLGAMYAQNPRDAITEDQVLEKLERAKANAAETMAKQQAAAETNERGAIRRAFATIGITDRLHPYTPEETQWMAEELLGCPVEDLHRHLVVVVESSCWLWVYDRYIGPYPIRTVSHVARTLLMPATTLGFTPDIETSTGVKPITADQLLGSFSTIASGLSYSALTERSYYDPTTQRLVLAACPRRRDLKPQWHADVDAWLRSLSGNKYDDLVEWLAAFAAWGRPLKAGLFIGKGGTGKSLLVSGLSNIFQYGAAAHLGEVMGNQGFNMDLKHTLVCSAEESAPTNIRGEARTAELRDFLSLRQHTIRIKYQPNASLLGCARVVMTANNDGMFAATHDLTLEDIEAIQERFFLLPVREDAKAYLDTVSTETKERWADRAIAEHVLFLNANMEDFVDISRRFLGPAASHDFTDRMLIQSGSRSTLLHWIVNFLENPAMAGRHKAYFTYDQESEVLYANTSAILGAWATYSPGNVPCPTARRLGTDLQALSSSTRKALRDPERKVYWAYPVDTSKIVQWSERYGMGVEEELMKSLTKLAETPVSQLTA